MAEDEKTPTPAAPADAPAAGTVPRPGEPGPTAAEAKKRAKREAKASRKAEMAKHKARRK